MRKLIGILLRTKYCKSNRRIFI